MDEISQRIAEYDGVLTSIVFSMLKTPTKRLLDEYINAGRVGVWEALLSYDATRGATERTYVASLAKFRMQDYAREVDHMTRINRRKMRQGDDSIVNPIAFSYSQPAPGDDDEVDGIDGDGLAIDWHGTPYHHMVADEAYTIRMEVINNHKHGTVGIDHMVHGEKILALANRLKVSESRVSQLIGDVRDKMLQADGQSSYAN